ncbi:MAG: hypothetical protein P4L57_12120 [Rhizomicrobium sp.]|nr:hypothetical protein [Rhizomicrobium sp.]
MRKIPIEGTILAAYRFCFGNIISIIGTMWFPMLVFVAVLGGFAYAILPHEWLSGHFVALADPQAFVLSRLPLFALAVPVIMVTGLLVSSMVRVGILRLALEEKPRLTLFWFSLDGRVWRMVAATVLVFVFFIICEIAVGITFGAANFVLRSLVNAPQAVVVLANIGLVAATFVAVIYVMARLFFFLPAVIVGERRLSLERAWALGEGNVLRIIVVMLGVIFPIYILAVIAIYATIIPTVLVQVLRFQPHSAPDAMAFLRSLWPLIPAIIGIELVAGVLLSGTVFGAIGAAYKAVTAPADG